MPEEWSEEEIEASVYAYLDMLEKHNNGSGFVKKHYYEKLSEKYNRSIKSIEYRMQNISYVLTLLKRPFLPGLKPKQNVGQSNIARIKKFIEEYEGKQNFR